MWPRCARTMRCSGAARSWARSRASGSPASWPPSFGITCFSAADSAICPYLLSGPQPKSNWRGRCDVARQRRFKDPPASLFSKGDWITASSGIDKRHFDDRLYLAAVHADPAKGVRHASLLAQVEHRLEESVETTLDAEETCEPRNLGLDRRAVENEHIRHEHAIGRTVMGVVERAHRMRQSVDRAEALLEGRGPHCRRAHHMRARFEVAAVHHRLWQVGKDEPHTLHRDAFGHRMVVRRTIGLEAVRKRVHS